MKIQELKELLESLAGQKAPFCHIPHDIELFSRAKPQLGLSQLNELLMLLGLDRVGEAFFQYLVDGTTEYEPESAIDSADELIAGVKRFRKLAIHLFGNIKYGFKRLSPRDDELEYFVDFVSPNSIDVFHERHPPVLPVSPIPAEDAYLTGYLVDTTGDQELEEKQQRIRTEAHQNHYAYLASDHLDVYVATSMRRPHEFVQVSKITRAIFESGHLTDLNLRWFDPTQAFCEDRIDKGLS